MNKPIRSIIIIVLALTLLSSLPLFTVIAKDAPTAVVSNVTAIEGGTVTVDISLKNNPGIVSAKFLVEYDASVLELTAYQGVDFADTHFGNPATRPFVVNWIDSVNPNNDTDGVIARLTFNVKSGAKLGKSAITLSYNPNDIYNFDFDNVYFAIENGSVTVEEKKALPDVDIDGDVDEFDAKVILQYVTGHDVEVKEESVDVNGDGEVNIRDAAAILLYLKSLE